MLPTLSSDALHEVARHLSPKAMGRMLCTCRALAAVPKLPVWQWLRKVVQKKGWAQVPNCAARFGKLDALRWADAHGCLLDKRTCSQAAMKGRLDVIQFLRQKTPPCPWDVSTCNGAARFGNLELIKWARAQTPPCDWETHTCNGAAEGGHLELLTWLRKENPPCPWD